MFQVWLRSHTASKAGMDNERYVTVSVHDAGSKTKRIVPNAYVSDAKSMLKTESQAVISRIGFHGATLKLAALLRDGWDVNVSDADFEMIGEFELREDAEKFRDEHLTNYDGDCEVLGRPGFRFAALGSAGEKKSHSFGQPISGKTSLATTRIESIVDNFGMKLNTDILDGAEFTNGKPMRSLNFIILYGAACNRDHNPENVCNINGVTFEEGEFKNYGQVFKKLLEAQIIQ